jgi:hypothetical protein
MTSFKRIVVQLLPPLLTDMVRNLRRRAATGPRGSAVEQFREAIRGAAPEWEAVPKADWIVSDGWLHPSIVDTQVAKWEGFSGSIARPKPLGMAHEALPGAPVNVSSHNIMMTFGYVLGRAVATASSRPVRVLDWGGGIGHYALLARQLFPETPIDYTICELQPLVEAGRKLVADVAFTSEGAASLTASYDLMICRMPFVDEADDFVVVQRPQRYGYDTEYTGWFLNRNKFVGFMQSCGYELDREFLNDERPTVTGAPEQCSYRGFLFERSKHPDRSAGTIRQN